MTSPGPFAYVGKPTPSREAPRFVRGRGSFVDDIKLPGMLHAVIGRSPHAHARIVSADGSQAARHPGVEAVVTSPEHVELTSPFRPGRYASGLGTHVPEYAMAAGKVRYVGEPVCALAASDRATAEDALSEIEVLYETLEAVTSPAQAVAPGAPLLFDEVGSNEVWRNAISYGPVLQALDASVPLPLGVPLGRRARAAHHHHARDGHRWPHAAGPRHRSVERPRL